MLSMERECAAHVQRSRILKKTPYDGTNRIRFIGYNLSYFYSTPFSAGKERTNVFNRNNTALSFKFI